MNEKIEDQIDRLAKFLMQNEMVTTEGGAVDVAIHNLEKMKELKNQLKEWEKHAGFLYAHGQLQEN